MKTESVFIRKLINEKLYCGYSVKELTTFDDYCLWWTVDHNFLRVFYPIARSPKKKKSYYVPRTLLTVFSEVWLYLDLVYSILLKLFIGCIFKIYGGTENHRGKQATILITTMSRWWGYRQGTGRQKNRKSDLFFEPLLQDLERSYRIKGTWRIEIAPWKEIPNFIDRLKNWYISFIPMNCYWSLSVWQAQKRSHDHFKKIFKKISEDPRFFELCKINDNDYSEFILFQFKLYFLCILPYSVKNIETTKRMLSEINPRLFILQSEYGWLERAMLIAADSQKVRTLAVQHGEIVENHPDYLFQDNEISQTGVKTSPFCPIPDMTAVFSSYYHAMLTKKSSYPPDSISVTGSPRFDVLFSQQDAIAPSKLLKKYQLPTGMRAILWATQCHGLSDDENLMNFNTMFAVLKDLDNCVLIIKQHPKEPEKYRTMIENCQEKYNIPLILPPKDANINELLNICSIFVTKYSTTGLEAIALKKPTIILNLSGEPDKVNYVREKVAFGVYTREKLKFCIEELLSKPFIPSESWKSFIEKHLSQTDGMSSKRLELLVRKMVTEQTKEYHKPE